MIEGHDFVDAYFLNNERTIVESLWYSETDDAYRTHVCAAEEGEAEWEKLLTFIDIDDLHERTYKRIAEQDEIFKETLIEIAKNDENSWVAYKDDLNKNVVKTFIDVIFKENLSEKDENEKEKLFLYKLELFEIDAVKNSKNKELKKKLRKSQNTIEATLYACQLVLGPESE